MLLHEANEKQAQSILEKPLLRLTGGAGAASSAADVFTGERMRDSLVPPRG